MKNQKGFTLVETAVAIGVVAMLSGIIIPLVLKSIADSKMARARNDIQVIASALGSQMKDTGGRPRQAAAGANDGTGLGWALWSSPGGAVTTVGAGGGAIPNVGGGMVAPGAAGGHGQTFANLFAAPQAQGNTLFNLGAFAPGAEIAYRGPYMGLDMAYKSDPWGSPYLIFGYNDSSALVKGPIWVVSAGPNKTIAAANAPLAAVMPEEWNYAAAVGGAFPSEDNIAVRVN
jgi:prepilin-type N-terminal cleavage/methylation domain-containing protein